EIMHVEQPHSGELKKEAHQMNESPDTGGVERTAQMLALEQQTKKRRLEASSESPTGPDAEVTINGEPEPGDDREITPPPMRAVPDTRTTNRPVRSNPLPLQSSYRGLRLCWE